MKVFQVNTETSLMGKKLSNLSYTNLFKIATELPNVRLLKMFGLYRDTLIIG